MDHERGPAALPIDVVAYGDAAVMVTIASSDAATRGREITVLRDRVLARRPPGVGDVVSGLESLLVEYDPLTTSADGVAYALGLLAELPASAGTRRPPALLDVPILVDADSAPDLDEVADELAIAPDELVARLERSVLTVALLAAAMAPMMSGLDVPASVRRRAQPRTDVPAGSIMVAGRHAIIQPFPGPSGWRVVGRTPLRIVDIARARPVAFAPGDTMRLRRVDAAEAHRLHGGFLRAQAGGAP